MYSFFNQTMVILKTLIYSTIIIIVYNYRDVILIGVYFSNKFSGCDCPNAILVKRMYTIKD